MSAIAILPPRHSFCLALLLVLGFGSARAEPAANASNTSDGTTACLTPAARQRLVIVKPVILCDDDGGNPAPTALPKTRIDPVYTRAGLEFIYLEPVRWNHGAARRGEISLNEIVRLGRERNVITADPRIVTMMFVSAVDGRAGPLGRGMQNGNVCFVALGKDGAADDPAKQAFVVAHEVGHCLGLRHAVDDPDVPDDVPNLQGDGAFADRLAVQAMHPTQAAKVTSSPLAVVRFDCYPAAATAAVLEGSAWESPVAATSDDNLRFMFGLAADAAIPAEQAARMAFVTARCTAMAEEFTDGEKSILRGLVDRITRDTGTEFPMFARLPWHFAKVKDGFCANLPHTRGLATVLTAGTIARLASEGQLGLLVLSHEKVHVVQRLNPGRFDSLYRAYGFLPLHLPSGEATRWNMARNPDAPEPDWMAAPAGTPPFLLATVFARGGDGGLGFGQQAFAVRPLPEGGHVLAGRFDDKAAVDAWQARFPIRTGHDHPNEVFAYLCENFLPPGKPDAVPDVDANPALKATRAALPALFRLPGE